MIYVIYVLNVMATGNSKTVEDHITPLRHDPGILVGHLTDKTNRGQSIDGVFILSSFLISHYILPLLTTSLVTISLVIDYGVYLFQGGIRLAIKTC